MVVEDISSIIDPRLSQVVLGKPFVEVSNMIHDSSIGVVKFTTGDNEISYKIPYKIEQYSSLSNLEKEHTKLVYFRNEEDKKRGVDYVMDKILGIWEDLGGNTRDLDSIWEETGQDYNLTRNGFKNVRTVPGDAVAIPNDAIKTYKRRLRSYVTVSEHNRLKETLRRFGKAMASKILRRHCNLSPIYTNSFLRF
nr:retrotransposon Orf1 [Tanacetum cinerariifolium]